MTDEQEVRYGITIADLAVECGVKHLVYSSGSATGETPTGVAHYDTKAEIERHIRRLPLLKQYIPHYAGNRSAAQIILYHLQRSVCLS